uniref:40S ribosomal protein S27 n=1 Tax=Solanum lycopersicum TaxID=4081 RepID=K4D6W7_SOLLC
MAREIHCFDVISDIIVRVEVEKNGTRKSTRVFVIVKYKVKKNFNFKVQKSDLKDTDLLHPPTESDKRKHKLMHFFQSYNSIFLDVKCQGCFQITIIFNHSQTVIICPICQQVLCQPTGGRAKLTKGCLFRFKEKDMMVLV